MVPRRMFVHGSPGWEMAFQSPRTATSDPETGVQRPAIRSIPAAIASISATVDPTGIAVPSLVSPRAIVDIPAAIRRSSKPAPGPPGAKVENKRRRMVPFPESLSQETLTKPQTSLAGDSFQSSGFDNAALDSDHGGV